MICSLYKYLFVCFLADRHVEKESLAGYIAKKREMFLVQVRHNIVSDVIFGVGNIQTSSCTSLR